ncbi:hypothetical protein IIZ81_00755 [Candidatus Saccharibacteria bacterium]|nr:hypothetical protein [Candidatus Saccharibacteria bacterium]
MSKRVGFNVLAQKLKHQSGLSIISSILVSVFLALFSVNVPIYADGPADSVKIYDVKTDRATATKLKKVKVEGYIGASAGGGTDYELGVDEIQVISEDSANTGYTILSVSQFTIVKKDGDSHDNMYYFVANGRPSYDTSSSPYTYTVRVCLLASDHSFAQCTDKISFGNDKKASSSNYQLSTKYDEPLDVGFYDIADEDKDDEDPTCLSENGLIGYIFCPIVDGLQDAISSLYESTIANSLDVSPELLKFDDDVKSMTAGDSTYEVWGYFRNLANIAFVILLFVIILSQISGMGISNYGVKKLLPRLIACIVLVNLSYFICQLAIDLSNILGQSIGGLIESMAEDVTIPAVKGAADGWGTVANLTVILALIVAGIYALATNPALLIPLILALLAGLIAIFALFVTLGIRRAAIVILVVVSPVALICYVLPNTKSIFDKWFNLFKALLLAFPIASIMVYGGLFASKVLIATWGPTTPYSLLGGFAVAVTPYFFIPKVINDSLGKLNTVVAKVQNDLTNRASRSFSQSGVAEGLQAKANQKHLDQLAHYKPEAKHGPFKKTRNKFRGWYNSHRPARSDRYLQDAMNGHKFDADHEVRKQDPVYIQNSERNMRIKEREEEYELQRLDPQQLGTMLVEANQNGDGIGRAAIVHALSKTQEGVLQIEAYMSSGLHTTEEYASMASVFSQKELDGMARRSPYAAAVLASAGRGHNVGTSSGAPASFDLAKSGLSFNFSADYENYSDWTKTQLRTNAEADYDTEFSVQYTRAMEEITTSPELANNVTLDSMNGANDYLSQRNTRIDTKATNELQRPSSYTFDPNNPPASLDGIQAGDLTSASATDKVFLIDKATKYAESGDLIGLEAAVKELDKVAASDLAGAPTQQAKEDLEAQHTVMMSSLYDKISAPSFSFKNGVSRDAVVGQIALFRSR